MQPIVLQQYHYAHQCMRPRNLAKCTPPTTSSNQTISTLHPHISASTRLQIPLFPRTNIKHNLSLMFQHNRVFGELSKTQHQNPEFGLGFKKNLQNKYISIQCGGGRGVVETQKCTIVLVLNSFSSCFEPLFPFSWAPPLLLQIIPRLLPVQLL